MINYPETFTESWSNRAIDAALYVFLALIVIGCAAVFWWAFDA